MRVSRGYGNLAILVIAVILLSALFVPGARAANHENAHFAVVNGLKMTYHTLTSGEMNRLMNSVGVREPGVNYNKIIDGHGTGLAPPSEQEWKGMVGHLKVADSIEGVQTTRNKVDLSKEKYFPPIGNQGAQGSCAAWAVTYYAYTYLEAKNKGWNASSGNMSYLMSPAWTYNRINNAQDQGSTFDDNARVLKTWGAATLSTMPYVDSIYTTWGGARAMREAPQHRIKDYYFIESNGDTSSVVTEIKSLLDKGIPVNFGIDADVFDDAFKDGNYIISSKEYDPSLTPNHGQTIVGYDDTISDDGDFGAFKVANSWGSGWGDKGYYWVTYKAFEEVDYNDQGFPMYMVDRTDYNPQLLAVLQFKNAPEMDVNVNFTVMNGTLVEWKNMYYNKELPKIHATMPTFIVFDITDLLGAYEAGNTNITVNITKSVNSNAELFGYYIEKYDTPYSPGAISTISDNAPGLPTALPCNITSDFKPYSKIDFNSAIDSSVLTWLPPLHSDVNWVGVPYDHNSGSSAMRSGPLGDYGVSVLSATINGPGELTFYWKVSSEENKDILTFYDNGTSKASISGEHGWTKVSVLIGGGTRTLSWVYKKDGTGTGGNDTAWMDTVSWVKRNEKVPSAPQNVTASAGTGFVSLSWKAPASDGGANLLDYRIYRGVNDTSMSLVATVDANSTSYNDTSVENGVFYQYWVRAENYVGESKAATVTALPVEFPEAPRNLNATGVFGGVNLTWAPPSNVNAAGLSNYSIYRAANGSHDFVKIASVNGTTLHFNDTTAPKGVLSDYYVVAVNWMGESKASDIASAMLYGVPDAPQNVKEVDGSGTVTITWTAPANDGGAAVTSYRIYRKAPGKDFTLAGEVNGTKNEFQDTGIANGVEYVYVVSAVNKYGEGETSEQVKAHPADIILNFGGEPYHMSYAELGVYVILIVAVIVAAMYALKRRKSRKSAPVESEKNEEATAENEEQEESEKEEQNSS